MVKKLLLLQEVSTTKDSNGNPRKIVIVNSLITRNTHDSLNNLAIEVGHRSPFQAVKEEMNDYDINGYDSVMWLEDMSVSVKEFKRLLKL